jgi:hypothetical protein
MAFGGFLVLLSLMLGMALSILAVGYLAVLRHFDEIPVSRWKALGMSSTVAAGFGAGFLTLGIFGFAIGQILGNENLGSLIGGLIGVGCWVLTTLAYGWRVTRRLAELHAAMQPSRLAPPDNREQPRLRIALLAIFLAVVVFVAGSATFAALNRLATP